MNKAVRAIIIENGKLLVMYRNKYGSQYYTLVGGQVKEDEGLEDALVREVREETGLQITNGRPVYIEKHPAPYNEQYIYLCEVAPHGEVAIQEYSEEGFMNRLDANIHKPLWVDIKSLHTLAFRTPQLYQAIQVAFKKGFPATPIKL